MNGVLNADDSSNDNSDCNSNTEYGIWLIVHELGGVSWLSARRSRR